MYNDLGFLAGNRLIVLVEAQSSWSENIVVRFLMYLGETYRRYIEKNDLELYTTKRMTLLKPELYVVYTGDGKTRPETISLKKSFWNTDDSCVEVEAKVIYDSKAGDILSQFIDFSHVFDSQRKLYSDDMRKAVQETIRICREKNVLRDYLKGEEAAAVMFAFADQEKEFNKALRTERREGISIGEARGEARGEAIGENKKLLMKKKHMTSCILQMMRRSVPDQDAVFYTRRDSLRRDYMIQATKGHEKMSSLIFL